MYKRSILHFWKKKLYSVNKIFMLAILQIKPFLLKFPQVNNGESVSVFKILIEASYQTVVIWISSFDQENGGAESP